MKKVNEHIKLLSKDFYNHSYNEYLRSQDNDPRNIVKTFPYISHWIMSFGDINRLILKQKSSNLNKIDEIINDHADEDATHGQWFIEDMAKLTGEKKFDLSHALKFLWPDCTQIQRLLTYKLTHYLQSVSSEAKYAIIEYVEELGKVGLEALTSAANNYEQVTGTTLKFFGRHHLEKETGHVVNIDTERQSYLASIELSKNDEKTVIKILDDLQLCFIGMVDELEIIRKKIDL